MRCQEWRSTITAYPTLREIAWWQIDERMNNVYLKMKYVNIEINECINEIRRMKVGSHNCEERQFNLMQYFSTPHYYLKNLIEFVY